MVWLRTWRNRKSTFLIILNKKEQDKQLKKIQDKKNKGIDEDVNSDFSEEKNSKINEGDKNEVDDSDEDAGLYFKEENISKQEMADIKDNIKDLRIKLLDLLKNGR